MNSDNIITFIYYITTTTTTKFFCLPQQLVFQPDCPEHLGSQRDVVEPPEIWMNAQLNLFGFLFVNIAG